MVLTQREETIINTISQYARKQNYYDHYYIYTNSGNSYNASGHNILRCSDRNVNYIVTDDMDWIALNNISKVCNSQGHTIYAGYKIS